MDVYTAIKIISIGISFFVCYLKLLDKTLPKKREFIVGFILIFLYFILNTVLSFKIIEPYKSAIIIIVLSFILWKYLRLTFNDSLIYVMISFAISHVVFMVFVTAFSLIFAFLPVQNIAYLQVVLQLAFSFVIYKMKFKITISNKKSFNGACFLIVGVIIGFYSFMRIKNYEDSEYLIIPSICLMTYGLYSIIKRESIISVNDNDQKQKINEMTLELSETMQSLDFISERDHKINKYLKAVYNAVWIYTNESTDIETKNKVYKMLNDLTDLRQSLQIETREYLDSVNFNLSELVLVDHIMLYMLEIAKQKGIELKINFDDKPDNILNFITQEQLCSLVSELIDNAMTAVEHNDNMIKKIHFMICRDSEIFQIIIKDNGLNFSKDVLDNIGKRKITTYKGGTGNGLWNVIKIMRLSKFSLIIKEHQPYSDDYTKSIIIQFDGRCKYKFENL